MRSGRTAWLTASLLLGALSGCERRTPPPLPPPQVGFVLPVRADVTLKADEVASVTAVNSVDLVARVPGFLTHIDYKDGAFVARGTLLFVIEQSPYRTKVVQAQGGVAAAQASLLDAKSTYDRLLPLAAKGDTSKSNLDAAKAALDSDAGNLQQQQANLAQAEINLSYTQIRAPFAGMVTTHLQSLGELVGASGPQTLATVVETDRVHLTANISQSDVAAVGPDPRALLGRHVQVRGDAGGVVLIGTIDYVAPQIDPGTGTLQVRALVANPGNTLMPGGFAHLSLPLAPIRRALLVPTQAVFQDELGAFVYTLAHGGRVRRTPVTLGQADGADTIVRGLPADAQVAVSGLGRLSDGAQVSVTQAPAGARAP